MRNYLLSLSFKYKGDFCKIKNAIKKEESVETIKHLNTKFITILDKEYPEKLKNIADPPFVIFYEGDISLLNSNDCISIIGSRNNSSVGKAICKKIISELFIKNIYITVSGLARGIDSWVHIFSIQKNVKTVAVLGFGINYLKCNKKNNLHNLIIENGGLIISEYPPNTGINKENFKHRNRIISALSQKLIIVEALCKSGTMNTAFHALNQNKEVYCCPGIAYSNSGCNKLIQEGAFLFDNIKNL